jgi:hypothetical protein
MARWSSLWRVVGLMARGHGFVARGRVLRGYGHVGDTITTELVLEITDKLRKPRDGRVYHELIGEAYIHGKMDGEALSTYATMEELNEAVVDFC